MIFKRLMTDEEVADLLHCSVRRVRYLRFTKQIAYVDIIPPLITDAALEAYVASNIQAATRPPSSVAGGLSAEEAEVARMDGEARLWVLRERMAGKLPSLSNVNWSHQRRSSWSLAKMGRPPPIKGWSLSSPEVTPIRPRKPDGPRLTKGKLRRARTGVWYVHWSEGRRSMRQTAKTKDRDQAELFLKLWRKTGGKLSGVLLQPSERRPPPDAELRQVGSGSWYLFWSDGRRSMRLSTRTKDEAEAKRIRKAWSAGKDARQPKISGLD